MSYLADQIVYLINQSSKLLGILNLKVHKKELVEWPLIFREPLVYQLNFLNVSWGQRRKYTRISEVKPDVIWKMKRTHELRSCAWSYVGQGTRLAHTFILIRIEITCYEHMLKIIEASEDRYYRLGQSKPN